MNLESVEYIVGFVPINLLQTPYTRGKSYLFSMILANFFLFESSWLNSRIELVIELRSSWHHELGYIALAPRQFSITGTVPEDAPSATARCMASKSDTDRI